MGFRDLFRSKAAAATAVPAPPAVERSQQVFPVPAAIAALSDPSKNVYGSGIGFSMCSSRYCKSKTGDSRIVMKTGTNTAQYPYGRLRCDLCQYPPNSYSTYFKNEKEFLPRFETVGNKVEKVHPSSHGYSRSYGWICCYCGLSHDWLPVGQDRTPDFGPRRQNIDYPREMDFAYQVCDNPIAGPGSLCQHACCERCVKVAILEPSHIIRTRRAVLAQTCHRRRMPTPRTIERPATADGHRHAKPVSRKPIPKTAQLAGGVSTNPKLPFQKRVKAQVIREADNNDDLIQFQVALPPGGRDSILGANLFGGRKRRSMSFDSGMANLPPRLPSQKNETAAESNTYRCKFERAKAAAMLESDKRPCGVQVRVPFSDEEMKSYLKMEGGRRPGRMAVR